MSAQAALELIYPHLEQRFGKVYAERWFEQQRAKTHSVLPPLAPMRDAATELLKSDLLKRPSIGLEATQRGGIAPKPELLVATGAEAATERLTSCLQDDLSRSQLSTFRFLHSVALTVAARRGYTPSVTTVTFFCPAEVVAFALGVHRTTLWRQLKPLLELGLLDVRPHMTTHRGQTLTDGCLWCIRLNPRRGKAPRLAYGELKHQYRNLSADIEAGRTAYALVKGKMQQSMGQTKDIKGFECILAWALPPLINQTPVSSDCCASSAAALETVLDVPFAAKRERGRMIGAAAHAIGYALGDTHSHAFYCKLLWNLLRRRDQGQDYFRQVYEMILRARADYAEGFARSAGALLISRLKEWEVWDWLERTPMTRVGEAQTTR